MKEQGLQIAALEGSLAHAQQSASEEKRKMHQQIAALQQVCMLSAVHTTDYVIAMTMQFKRCLHGGD